MFLIIFHLAESTIEARIIGLQDLKQSVVGELINENNSGTFVRTAGTNVQGMEDRDSQRGSGSGFGGALWSSVKDSVLHGPLQNRSVGDSLSDIGYSAEVTRHMQLHVYFVINCCICITSNI